MQGADIGIVVARITRYIIISANVPVCNIDIPEYINIPTYVGT